MRERSDLQSPARSGKPWRRSRRRSHGRYHGQFRRACWRAILDRSRKRRRGSPVGPRISDLTRTHGGRCGCAPYGRTGTIRISLLPLFLLFLFLFFFPSFLFPSLRYSTGEKWKMRRTFLLKQRGLRRFDGDRGWMVILSFLIFLMLVIWQRTTWDRCGWFNLLHHNNYTRNKDLGIKQPLILATQSSCLFLFISMLHAFNTLFC